MLRRGASQYLPAVSNCLHGQVRGRLVDGDRRLEPLALGITEGREPVTGMPPEQDPPGELGAAG